MTMKWFPWPDECHTCGSAAEIYTTETTSLNTAIRLAADLSADLSAPGWEYKGAYDDAAGGVYDGNVVRCVECGETGYVSADEESCCTVWHAAEPDCHSATRL